MIRPLRRRHLFFATLMLMGLPGLVIYGYVKGRSPVTMQTLPKIQPVDTESFPLEVWHKSHLWKNFPSIHTRLLTNTSPEHHLAVELTYRGTIAYPDLLLYWSPRSYSARSGIGEAMVLIGSLNTNETTLFRLPAVARHRDGFLILYSLGLDEVVSEATLVNPLK
jgi:hypothetical protein